MYTNDRIKLILAIQSSFGNNNFTSYREYLQANVCAEHLIHVLAIKQIDSQFQALRHERREQEEAERHDLEHEQLPGDIRGRVAGRGALEAVLAGGGEREPDEDGDREEGVDVDDAVEGRDVDAGGGQARVR